MGVGYFDQTDVDLLRAQQQSHILLTQHLDLLTLEQERMLRHFQQQMDNKRTRNKLKPAAAYLVLNIASKVHRQLFKQHRQAIKAPNSGNNDAR